MAELVEFLIYRVELKALSKHFCSSPCLLFLIYRVELKEL